ncbi:hypothetical protein [Streptomyces apocyni]|uniref:hypothetical protein n=1 Tax=Streptomyces apocyni TaxID=2654677 RepID=UPI0012EA31F1|nr:hypothetical protein [Streptomyces apocyni]
MGDQQWVRTHGVDVEGLVAALDEPPPSALTKASPHLPDEAGRPLHAAPLEERRLR